LICFILSELKSTIMAYFIGFFIELWSITVEMSPYLLLGFLFAGILKVWFPQRWIDRYMGKNNFASVFNTALLGVPLPLCSCGVIPTGVSFYRNGASKGASVSFLISTPQTGVDSVLVTYSMLGLPFALIRVVVAFVTGILGGLVTNVVDAGHYQQQPSARQHVAAIKQSIHPLWRMLKYGFFEFLMDIAKWLIVGLLIAAALAVIIPDDFFTMYLNNEWLSMFLVLLASVPLYICATASVPIAAVLMLKGLAPGAALVFLMAGPATNAATITVINKVFGKKTLGAYLGSIIGGALFFGFVVNALLPREWFALSEHVMHHGHQHQGLPPWLQIGSSLLLILLIINGYFWQWRRSKEIPKAPNTPVDQPQSILMAKPVTTAPIFNVGAFVAPSMAKGTVYEVHGMTCNHCKLSVETNVGKLPGITKVNANPQTKRVMIEGDKFDETAVKSTIEQLGYKVIAKL
jgi:uncharacterized membrane protein YraQ (UPF0718 family)/copper chaperone CopZ